MKEACKKVWGVLKKLWIPFSLIGAVIVAIVMRRKIGEGANNIIARIRTSGADDGRDLQDFERRADEIRDRIDRDSGGVARTESELKRSEELIDFSQERAETIEGKLSDAQDIIRNIRKRGSVEDTKGKEE